MALTDDTWTHAVTITPKGTVGGNGEYPYDGTPVVTTGRVVPRSRVIHYGTDTEWVATLTVYLRADETVTEQDRITYDSKTRIVREIREHRYVTGVLSSYEVLCG